GQKARLPRLEDVGTLHAFLRRQVVAVPILVAGRDVVVRPNHLEDFPFENDHPLTVRPALLVLARLLLRLQKAKHEPSRGKPFTTTETNLRSAVFCLIVLEHFTFSFASTDASPNYYH